MITLDEVAAIAADLPEVVESDRYGGRTWAVGKKVFAWERGFSKADLKRFGTENPPQGPILAVRTADLHEKEAVLASGTKGFFTISHFDGYAAVLVQLKVAGKRAVRELLVDGWFACAAPKLADDYASRHSRQPPTTRKPSRS